MSRSRHESPFIETDLEAAQTRIAELEGMFENGVPSYSRALQQRDYAVGALKDRDRMWCRALARHLDARDINAITTTLLEMRDTAATQPPECGHVKAQENCYACRTHGT